MKDKFIIDCGSYPFSLIVSVGTTAKQEISWAERCLDRRLAKCERQLIHHKGGLGRVTVLHHGGIIFWLADFKNDPLWIGRLVHEAAHVGLIIFDQIGMQVCEKNEEALCYEIQYLVDRIMSILMAKANRAEKKKRKR